MCHKTSPPVRRGVASTAGTLSHVWDTPVLYWITVRVATLHAEVSYAYRYFWSRGSRSLCGRAPGAGGRAGGLPGPRGPSPRAGAPWDTGRQSPGRLRGPALAGHG